MDKEYLIQLTNSIYRLTLLFPKKEPLRYKIREKASDILASSKEEDIETLKDFLEVAKSQNWVSPSDILAIQKEYDNLKRGLKKVKPGKSNPTELKPQQLEKEQSLEDNSPQVMVQGLAERQEKILAFLKESGRVQVWQAKEVFPEVTKRTLRRDFEQMLRKGIIERIGQKNDTFYQIKIQES